MTLTGGSHLEERERERERWWRWDLLGRLYWADWADWAAQKRKEGGRKRWAGLERKEKREGLFVLFCFQTQTPFE